MSTLAALITAYHRTDAAEFSTALHSLLAQTRPADDLVVVLDGPVADAVRHAAEELSLIHI